MANKGYMAKIGLDTSDFDKKLKSLQKEINATTRVINQSNKAGVSSSEMYKQKQTELQSAIEETKKKLEQMKSVEESAKNALSKGDISAEDYADYQRQVASAAASLRSYENELAKVSQVSAGAKDNTAELSKAFGEVKTGASKVVSDLSSIAAVAAGVGTAVAGAVEAGAVAITKQAVEAYGQYEQMVGGIETLFGDGAEKLEAYAENAFQTAQMSANDYMEIATSFAARLSQGLGGDMEKAAEITDMAITDMSDNVSKLGTDMSSVQYAYQGIMRQNYTMLDNLKIGYGGTQAEMARLINDSGVLGDTVEVTANTLNTVSFDKMIEAIHVVQQNLGITGTTALEAGETIQGSAASIQAAWENLVTGFADSDADLDKLIDDVVDAAENTINNIAPKIATALPRIEEGIGELAKQILPAATEAIDGILDAVFENLGISISDYVPELTDMIDGLISGLNWFAENLDGIISLVKGLGTAWLSWKIATTLSDVGNLITGLINVAAAAETATVGQLALNAAMNVNVIAAVASAAVGLANALASYITTQKQARYEAEYANTALEQEYVDTVAEIEAIEKSKQATADKAEETKNLIDVLDDMVDENGKVTEGMEDQAQVILDEVNDALGSHLEIVNGMVTGYEDLSGSIDDYLAKLKTQAEQEAYYSLYSEAVKNGVEIDKAVEESEKAYKEAQSNVTKLNAEIAELERQSENTADYMDENGVWHNVKTEIDTQIAEKEAERDAAKEEADRKGNVWSANVGLQRENNDTITYYESKFGKTETEESTSPTKEEAIKEAKEAEGQANAEATRKYYSMEQTEEQKAKEEEYNTEVEALKTKKKLRRDGLENEEKYYSEFVKIQNRYKPFLKSNSEEFWNNQDEIDDYYSGQSTETSSSGTSTASETSTTFGTSTTSEKTQSELESDAKSELDSLNEQYKQGLIDREKYNADYKELQEKWAEDNIDIEEYANAEVKSTRKQVAQDNFDALKQMYDDELIDRAEFNRQYNLLCEDWAEDNIDISSYTAEKIAEINEEELKSFKDNTKSIMDSIADEWENLADKKESLADNIAGGDLFESVTDENGNERKIFDDLSARTDKIKKYMQDYRKLKATNIPQDLMSEILSMDFDDRAAVIQELLNMTDDNRQLYYSDWNDYKAAQSEAANMELEDETQELAEKTTTALNGAYDDMADLSDEAGRAAAKAYIEGYSDEFEKLGFDGSEIISKLYGGSQSSDNQTASGTNDSTGTNANTSASNTLLTAINNGDLTLIAKSTPLQIVIGSQMLEATVGKILQAGRITGN